MYRSARHIEKLSTSCGDILPRLLASVAEGETGSSGLGVGCLGNPLRPGVKKSSGLGPGSMGVTRQPLNTVKRPNPCSPILLPATPPTTAATVSTATPGWACPASTSPTSPRVATDSTSASKPLLGNHHHAGGADTEPTATGGYRSPSMTARLHRGKWFRPG